MKSAQGSDRFLEKIHCCAKPPWETLDPKDCLAEIGAAMASPLESVKNDGMKRTLKIHLAPWGTVCLQDFQWNPKRKAVSPFRWSRGKRIWHYSGEIAGKGIPILEPLLFLEVKRACFVTRTVIATPWLEEKVDLGKIAMSEELRRVCDFDRLLNRAVQIVSRLHGLGFVHGDLKWSNFVHTPARHPGLILTDLDGVRRSSSRMLQGKDYARFVLSAPAYGVDWVSPERLMHLYLSASGETHHLLEWSLRWHVERKRGRYARENVSSGGEQKTGHRSPMGR